MSRRRLQFESTVSNEERELIEKALVQSCLQVTSSGDNASFLLSALRALGRETDRSLVPELEKKYEVKLNTLAAALEVFSLTYKMWKVSYNLKNTTYQKASVNELAVIKREMQEALKSTQILSSYSMAVTHVTDAHSAQSINRSAAFYKSDTGLKDHYEGDGVYAGTFDSYSAWSRSDNDLDEEEQKTFVFEIPLEDTLPIIVSFNYPKGMLVIGGDMLDIQGGGQSSAVGLHQWRQLENTRYEVTDWKLELLRELFKCDVITTVDTEGIETVILDTDRPFIEWAAVSRALLLPRVVLKSEISKTDLDKDLIHRSRGDYQEWERQEKWHESVEFYSKSRRRERSEKPYGKVNRGAMRRAFIGE